MSQLCPHCGSHLPNVRDAFCPDCRNPLDELPGIPSPDSPFEAPTSSEGCNIPGLRRMAWDDLAAEIAQGGRLVVYQYCVSIGILTFLRSSEVYLVRSGESAVLKGLHYTL